MLSSTTFSHRSCWCSAWMSRQWGERKTVWTSGSRGWWLASWGLAGGQWQAMCPTSQNWVQSCSTSSLTIQMMGHWEPSASLLMIPNCKDWWICWMSHCCTKHSNLLTTKGREGTNPCTSGGTTTCTRTSTCQRLPSWITAWQKKTWSSGGHQVEHEPICLAAKKANGILATIEKILPACWGRQSSLFSAHKATSGVLGSPQERHEHTGQSLAKGHKND